MNTMLVPVIFYIDASVTGQFDKLSVESLKITLGIFNRKARDKPHAWRDIGFVPNYHKSLSRGKKILGETGHAAAAMLPLSDEEGSVELVDDDSALDDASERNRECFDPNSWEHDDDAHESQDLHHVLSIMLVSCRHLLREGLLWHYKYRGKTHKNTKLEFYTEMWKVDGDEADKLSGKYTTRTGNVANLCRCCCCPTEHTDWVYGDNCRKKKEDMMARMVSRKDEVSLQRISQRNLKNACHNLKHSTDVGVHGMCPMEMLHHILLGMFAYLVAGLKEQIGPTSKLLQEINGLGREYGRLLAHQSDRDLPKTTFAKGIFQGKIM